MKIVLIINILDKMGGAERAFVNLANSLASRNYNVNIISFEHENAKSFYKLHSSINWIKIDDSYNINSKKFKAFRLRVLKRSFLLKKKLQFIAPSVVISFINFTNIYTTVVCRFLKIPVIISERSNPLKKRMPFRWEKIRNFVYPLANALVLQTKGVSKCYTKKINDISYTIQNIVLKPNDDITTKKNFPSPYILALGRLRFVKGFDILIKAFHQISHKYPNWKLIILGEGKERTSLTNLISTLNLNEKVLLPGAKKNPAADIVHSDIFVLSSRWEGFPNSLAEAMANGACVLSSNCDFGPQEIIDDNENGLLFISEEIKSLSNSLEKLINSQKLRDKLSQNAKKIIDTFGEPLITRQWIDLIEKVKND